jgi:tetratricopeptide (TPR) repeat protein
MKRIIIAYLLLAFSLSSMAQTTDYRTTEDGLNKLFNNPEFVEDVINLGTEDLTLEKLNSYFTKYLPEYSSYKIDNNIDFNKLYLANSGNVSTELLADKLGGLLKLNPAQTQSMKNIFTGNLKSTPINQFSAGYGNLLFERGKDAKVDLAVDFAVDLFQSKFGDGGTNSTLIDIGGGILGALLSGNGKTAEANKERKAELKKELARIQEEYNSSIKEIDDYSVYNLGDGAKITSKMEGREDLILHYKANSLNGNVNAANCDEVIKLLNEAINLYKQNPNRSRYLYLAYKYRGECKMQKGAFRAAIIDYYYAQEILKNILNQGHSTTTSLLNTSLTPKDLVILTIKRAYAKYKLADYKGTIEDCKLAKIALVNNSIAASGKPYDYIDIINAIVAMSQFHLKLYEDSYQSFSIANLKHGMLFHREAEIVVGFRELGDYFFLDIEQIKGLCCYKANKINEAITIYQNLITNEEQFAQVTMAKGDISAVYSTLGSFYYKMGDKTKAISHLDKAILFNPYQLEYYYKRGTYKQELGQTAEANADFKIVKEPESLSAIKKDIDYYYKQITKFKLESNNNEVFQILKEVLIKFPEDNSFFYTAVGNSAASKSKSQTKELADLLILQEKKYHLLMSLFEEFSGNMQGAETKLKLAFDHGLGFYECFFLAPFNLKEKPYYFKLFVKYGTKTNNRFIPLEFNNNTARIQDSICRDMINQVPENIKELIKTGCDRQAISGSGNFEEYLRFLNSINKMSYIDVFDKIECLIILNRGKEAHEFAKNIVTSFKTDLTLKSIYDISIEGRAIQNFAKESYEW